MKYSDIPIYALERVVRRGYYRTTTDDLHAIGEHSFARLVQGVRTRQYPGWAGEAVYHPDRFASMTTWRVK